MDDKKVLAYHDEQLDHYAILQYKDTITTETIENIFSNFLKDKMPEGQSIEDLYRDDYQKPFALYSIDIEHPIHRMKPYQLLGYSYGLKYNRKSENMPMLPKIFFLSINNVNIQLRFLKNNIILSFIDKKDIGRDSYYVSNYQYITKEDEHNILRSLVKDYHNLYLGSNYLSYDTEGLTSPDIMRLIHINNKFEEYTGFKKEYSYIPYEKVTLSDLIENTAIIQEREQQYKKSKKVSINNMDAILNIRKSGGNILPVKPG